MALFGGTLIGMGVPALVRHRASVGGIGLPSLLSAGSLSLAVIAYHRPGRHTGY